MNLNTLNYVIAIAEEGNFTKAAKKLFISQPTLSQSIQMLENQLGTKLFERGSSPIRPTQAGEEYLAWARQVLDSEAQTMRRISDIVQNRNRSLVVGISPYRSLRILPEVLTRFYQETKGNCRVTLLEQRSSEYVRLMEEGKLDLLIDKPVSDDSPYETVILAEEKILMVVPVGLSLPVLRHGNAEDGIHIPCEVTEMESLRDVPVIMLSDRQHMGRAFRQIYEALGVKPNVVLDCQSLEMAFLMASQGLGITLVPESIITSMPSDPRVCYYILKDYPLSRTMAALYPKHRYLTQDARRFIELMQETVAQLATGEGPVLRRF